MTTETATVGPRAETAFDELDFERELLLLDSEWIDAEFAAIMIASGFGDRLIVSTGPRPLVEARPTAPARPRGRPEFDRRHAWSRVRSPPARS